MTALDTMSQPANPPPPQPPRSTAEGARMVRSEDILQGHREVTILHNNERYRLMVTRNGKLILQK